MLSLAATAYGSEAIHLASDGKTDYRLVIANEPSIEVMAAADELAGCLKQVTGAEFPIVKAAAPESGHRIFIGASKALSELGADIDWESLGPEGFVIGTVDGNLVIAGGPQRGTINGVYTFLEDVIGCRWYTPTFSVVPHKPTLSVGPLDIQYVPPFESRFVFGGCASDMDWAARQRFNTLFFEVTVWTPGHLDTFINNPKLAGSYYYAGRPQHTLGDDGLLPYAEFDRHAEYFAEVNGRRFKQGQPCMTHPDLLPLVVKNARTWLRDNPGARIISISQRDGDFVHHGCHCARCNATYEQHSKTDVYMRFVNQVAAELARDDPDILVDTLAYHWTREPPKHIKMHKNVVVRYCMGGATCYYHGLDECELNDAQNVYNTLLDWIRITPRVWVWYYVHGGDELHPIPVFNSISHNFKLLRDAGVKGFFIQTAWGRMLRKGGGLLDLQAYLFAKVMWDPDYDVQKGIEEFCRDCYGAAAPQLISYVRMVNDESTYVGVPPYVQRTVDEYESAFRRFHAAGGWMMPMRTDKLREMDNLFDEAERAVADDPGVLERVKVVRLAVQYAILEYAEENDPIYAKAMRDFPAVAKRAGVSRVRNIKDRAEVDLDEFLEEKQKLAEIMENKAAIQKTTTTIPFSQEWRFKIDPAEEGVPKEWFRADVDDGNWATVRSDTGTGWESQGFAEHLGYGWYRGKLPPLPEKKRSFAYIYFGGVDEQAWVYLNGKPVFDHTVASTGLTTAKLWEAPFSVDVSQLLHDDGPNVLAVRVHNEAFMGGIWKPVYLILSDVPVDVRTQGFAVGLSSTATRLTWD